MVEVLAPDPNSRQREWIVTGLGDMPLPQSEWAWRALPEALTATLILLRWPAAQPEPCWEQPESDRMQKEFAEVKE